MPRIMYNESGERLYFCLNCFDCGFVHPRYDDGKPDYSRVIPCPKCRPESFQRAVGTTQKNER